MRRTRLERALPVVWALVLALLVLGPGLGPGFVLVRDMVWVPDLALTSDALGLGSGLPRAVPSDAWVAVLDEVVPGLLLQKLVLVGALAGGGVGALRLLPDGTGLAARLAVVTAYGWNALVAERLLMGAWPVLVGYAVLPWVLDAALRWRGGGPVPGPLLVLVPLGSLSASAGLATAVALLAGGAGRGRTARSLLLLAAADAPWVVAGVLHGSSATSDAAGAEVFALSGEGSLPGPLAALTLGGIWNTDVQPASRTGALGWVALIVLIGLVAVGWRTWWRRAGVRERTALLVCWGVGYGLAVLTWAAPDAVGWASAHVPGAGLVRDGSRALVLCAPLLVVLVGEAVCTVLRRLPATRPARVALGVAAALLPVALLPDLAWGVGRRLAPATYPATYADARAAVARTDGDVLVLPLSAYRAPDWNDGTPVLDPLGRYLRRDAVQSDVLVVDGVALAGEDPRVRAAAEALALATPEERSDALGRLGVGVVVTDPSAPGGSEVAPVAGERVLDTPVLGLVVLSRVSEREVGSGWEVAMGAAWIAHLLPLGCALLRRLRVASSRQ